MSDFALNSISFQQAAQPQQTQAPTPPAPPQPSKDQSDHKPLNASTSSRGPAVVLSGALAQGTDRKRDTGSSQSGSQSGSQGGASQQASTQSQASGHHINHVL
ncbi:hypothetical protein [Phenylobacterium sp.]|jgi:hypothetical protein|uniref:hypothetical protein n=1 Tax=Phenylobacterium sp. TaxID=1871053 RepID=UPI002F421061